MRSETRISGYTLLEMCLVLVILTIIVGISVPLTHGILVEQQLDRFTNCYCDIATQTRKRAVVEGIAYAVRFEGRKVTIAPWSGSETRPAEVIEAFEIPADVEVAVRADSHERWQKMNGQIWIFQAGGICDYWEIRTRAGKSWKELAFNPLTAIATETASHYE